MTTDELIDYFQNKPLPKGRINFSSFESTDDAAEMVRLAFARIESKGSGVDTALGVLERLRTYLEGQATS